MRTLAPSSHAAFGTWRVPGSAPCHGMEGDEATLESLCSGDTRAAASEKHQGAEQGGVGTHLGHEGGH